MFKDLCTPSESEKDKRTSKTDQRINVNHLNTSVFGSVANAETLAIKSDLSAVSGNLVLAGMSGPGHVSVLILNNC